MDIVAAYVARIDTMQFIIYDNFNNVVYRDVSYVEIMYDDIF